MATATTALPPGARWYSRVSGANWRTLGAAFVGWGFDGYETQALLVVIAPAMADLLSPGMKGHLATFVGVAVGTALLGWAIGGVLGSVLADYVGRKRVMVVSMLMYALFTGLTALSPSYAVLLVFRFLTGMAMGSEWGTGTAMIAETWPAEARAKGAGLMQAGFGLGQLLAALVWFLISPLGDGSWRWVFVVGVLPALFTVWIRGHVPESERWQSAVEDRRWAATDADADRLGAGGGTESGERRPLTLVEIWRQPESRRRMAWCLVLSVFSLSAWYAVITALPLFTKQIVTDAGIGDLAHWTSLSGVIYSAAGVIGYASAGFVADRIGRKRFFAVWLVGALIMDPILFYVAKSTTTLLVLAAVNGFFTLGIFSGFTIYLPELFSSGVRTTAIGVIFNGARLVACVGPVVLGTLIDSLGGVSEGATIISGLFVVCLVPLWFLPETRGRPLPA